MRRMTFKSVVFIFQVLMNGFSNHIRSKKIINDGCTFCKPITNESSGVSMVNQDSLLPGLNKEKIIRFNQGSTEIPGE
jgi:hypothetical protein